MTGPDGTPFLLVSGAGNDFIALVERPAPAPETIRAWCRRGLSVGADGLFTLHRLARERYALDYANADGARARPVPERRPLRGPARLRAGTGRPETDDRDRRRRPWSPSRSTTHARPSWCRRPARGKRRRSARTGRNTQGRRIDVGVPHFVLWWPGDLDQAPVASLGPVLRSHPDLGPEGANVHFVRLDPPGRLGIRSYERGVEAETLACGTGVVAAAACAVAEGRLSLPVAAATHGGFELQLEAAPDGPDGLGRWRLSGDARIVARGRIAAAATA